jgi:Ca2+-binding RTX toxin-like protein
MLMSHKVLLAGLLVCAVVAPPAASAAPVPTATERSCRGTTATIVGTPLSERITGTRGPDVIVGLGGDDTIFGLAGDDVVCGNGGGDDLHGGRGHDRLEGGRDGEEQRNRYTVVTGDLLEGGPGDDHLDPGLHRWSGRVAIQRRDSVSYRHSDRAVTVDLGSGVAAGEGSDTVVAGHHLEVAGSRHDDVLQGSEEAEVLNGGRGDDAVRGGGGRDAVLGYRGDDQLAGEQGRDLVISTAGVSTADGGDGRDLIFAGSRRPTTVLGGPRFDFVSRVITAGETGVIDGGTGDDHLELDPQLWFGRDPVSTLDVPAGTVVTTAGEDSQTTQFSGISSYTVWDGPWVFRGSETDDFVQVLLGRLEAHGLGGDDRLIGAGRADLLDGGDGADEVWGGRGDNTCLDAEAGDCYGLPWDTAGARVVAPGATSTSPSRLDPHALVARWYEGRGPSAWR